MWAGIHVLMMVALPILAGLAAAALIGRVAGARIRRWHAGLKADGGEAAVQGKLVVLAGGCDALVLPRGRTLAAVTSWVSRSRAAFDEPRRDFRERAKTLAIAAEEGEIELFGDVEVTAGSEIRWEVGRRHLGDAGFLLAMLVESGDAARAYGRLVEVADDEGEGEGYRGKPARKRLEPARDGGCIRLVTAAEPKLVRSGRGRQPAVLLAALPFLWFPLSALYKLGDGPRDLDERCKLGGVCHALPQWRAQPLAKALAKIAAGDHFTWAATSAGDCAQSQLCRLSGACSLVGGKCAPARDDDCLRSWNCAAFGACSAGGGKCVPHDEDCAVRDDCLSFGRCSARDGSCQAVTASDCAHTSYCEDLGSCSPVDGACAAASDADCARSYYCPELGHCAVRDKSCVASDAGCKHFSGCRQRGECSAAGDGCGVTSDEDCRWSDVCAREAECHAVAGRCRQAEGEDCAHSDACGVHGRCGGKTWCEPTGDKDCAASLACKERGACSLIDGKCRKSCADDPDCREDGRCTFSDGRCLAGSDADCKQARVCAINGACSSLRGECRAARDEDCRGSHYCHAIGNCAAREGRCEASSRDCSSRPSCKALGKCTWESFRCVVGGDADCKQSDVCARRGWCVAATASGQYGFAGDRACYREASVTFE